jgi:GR25 family glycosyltransferase involved in LPS biosynthesis
VGLFRQGFIPGSFKVLHVAIKVTLNAARPTKKTIMLFGTGLASRLPVAWRKRIHRLLSPYSIAHRRDEPQKPQRPPLRAKQADAQQTKYATDSVLIVGTDNLNLHGHSDLGVSDNVYIALTTTPIRARSQEIFEVLDSLVKQRRSAAKIFLALPAAYKRSFAVDWKTERPRFIHAVRNRYGSQIEVIDCKDDGPATKLLGLLDHGAKSLKSKDTIIVVDDDIIYSDNLVYLHELCHSLYQCDVGLVDQDDVIESWIPLKFKRCDLLFCDNEKQDAYGWLSFSIKYDQTKELLNFFSDVVASIPDSVFHDDAIFSAYIKKFGLYTTHINSAPLGVFSRTDLDGAIGAALRTEVVSNWQARLKIEEMLDEYLFGPGGAVTMKFHLPPYIPPRPVRNCSGLTFCNSDRNMHFAAHYLAADLIVITISIFDSTLTGEQVEIDFSLAADFFRVPICLESQKFSIIVQAHRPLFEPLADHAELPVVQTNSNSAVSRNKLYSVCTILNNTPTHAYLFFDEEARAEYIKSHFSAIVGQAYESLIPAAYRADLFRYLFAYLTECVYFDVKMILDIPISGVYHLLRDGQLFVGDVGPKHICNGFFINRRLKSEVFKYAIALCLDRIISNDHGSTALSVTGPEILGLAKYSDGNFAPKLFNVFEGDNWQESTICDEAGVELVKCSYPGYYDEDDYLQRHYHVFWMRRHVFRYPFSDYTINSDFVLKGVDHLLWINLGRATERKREMEEILGLFPSLPRTRIEAVDAQCALPWANDSDIDDRASKYEIACCLSHLKAMDCAFNLEGEHFLILEDDISLRFFPFHSLKDTLEKIMERAPDDWEVISLSAVYVSKLGREYTDWNKSFDDGFHIAGTAAYLINRSALTKIRRLFEIRDGQYFVRKADDQKVWPRENDRWFVADFFIYSNLKSYVYRNKIFVTRNNGSYIHEDHVEWHKRAQSITFNHIDDEIILRQKAELPNAAATHAMRTASSA